MERLLIYGTSNVTTLIIDKIFKDVTMTELGVIGLIGYSSEFGETHATPVYRKEDIPSLEFDKVVVISKDSKEATIDLNTNYYVPAERIVFAGYLVKTKIIYQNRFNTDSEVQQTIKQLEQQNYFDVWCGYCPEPSIAREVLWDPVTGMPFVTFGDKRIYYPKDHTFEIYNYRLSISGLEFEQQPTSPHLYIKNDHTVNEGDVLVDAGVCEGNFAIRFADKCSKIYLIESDPKWIYPLQLTFKDYMDKVVIVNKFLGDVDDENCITLDSLLDGQRCDFLKMDIEGAEVLALSHGKQVLRNNNMKCSICSYHRHGHEEEIRKILDECGYQTHTSRGHMIFSCDPQIFDWCELRHGIVYGRKE